MFNKRDIVLIKAEIEGDVNGGYAVTIWTIHGRRIFLVEKEELQPYERAEDRKLKPAETNKEVYSRSIPSLNKPTQFDTHGPAIEGHTIAVIHSIREEEEPSIRSIDPSKPDGVA